MHSECGRRCFLIRGVSLAAGMALGGAVLGGCNKQSEKKVTTNKNGETTSYCGLNCLTCQIYLATRETDPKKQRQMREGIACYIRGHFDPKTRAEDITDCDGCTVKGGRLFSECQECEVRKCAMEKGLKNCAYCSAYACEKLKEVFESEGEESGGKKRLDAIRKSL
jgi:hypothetical protein